MNEIETPVWIKYAGDIFFLACFIIVFFFVKPLPQNPDDEDEETDQPNPLEKLLKSDEESAADDHQEKPVEK